MLSKFATLLTSQSSMMPGWLKAAAPSNVRDIIVTELVFQTSGWLNDSATQNVPLMDVTSLVSQTSSELKARA